MEDIAEIVAEKHELTGCSVGDYICSKKLGEGSFATVYKGYHIQNEDQIVAIKVTDKEKYSGNDGEKILKFLNAEAKAMAMCNSEHIVKCFKQYRTKRYIIFVLQYCNSESLFEQIQKRGKIPQPEAKRILKQLVIGFAEMHRNNIIHRDLKPENIFKHNEKYKIGDFGFCKIFQSLNDLTRTPLGTLVSMAPEVIDSAPYGIKADLWSLGTVYYQMLFGNPPYISFSYTGMRKAMNKNSVSYDGISEQSAQFFRNVFIVDTKQRLSWTQLYKLPLFRSGSMVILQNHQDNTSLDDAYQTHKQIQQKQKKQIYENAQDQIQQALLIPNMSNLIDLIQFDQVSEEKMILLQEKDHYQKEIKLKMLSYKDQLNFQMQKSLFIYNQIFKPIILLSLDQSRKLAQFSFLILSRCFYIMSPLNDALKKQTNIFNWKYYKQFLNDSNQTSFLKDFSIHYKAINDAKNKASDDLYTIEDYKLEQVKDFLRKSIFSRNQYQRQNTFLCGIQGKDYSKQQHVQFINNNYINDVINTMLYYLGHDKNDYCNIYRALESFKNISLLQYNNGKGKLRLQQIYAYLKLKYQEI